MNNTAPDHTDPVPPQVSPHRVGTLMMRFVGLLLLAVVVMALAWG